MTRRVPTGRRADGGGGTAIAWIRTVPEDEASGVLARLYEAAQRRAGGVAQILKVQSLTPETLRSSTSLYVDIMQRPSSLERWIREALAVVVSRQNGCHY